MTRKNMKNDHEKIRVSLQKLLEQPEFSRSINHKKILTYLVDNALDNPDKRINGYDIAFDVMGLSSAFDPLQNSIVRVEMKRLRECLDIYNARFTADQIQFRILKGRYQVTFHYPLRIRADNAANYREIVPVTVHHLDDGLPKDRFGLDACSILKKCVSESIYFELSDNSDHKGFVICIKPDRMIDGQRFLLIQVKDLHLGRHNFIEIHATPETFHEKLPKLVIQLERLNIERPRTNRVLVSKRTPYPQIANDLIDRGYQLSAKCSHECLLVGENLVNIGLEYDPNNSKGYAVLSRIMILKWKLRLENSLSTIADSVRCAERAIEIDPSLAFNNASIAWASLWSERGERALLYSKKAVEISQRDFDARLIKALIFVNAGELESARYEVQIASSLSPFRSAFFYYVVGMVFLSNSEFESALRAFETGCKLNHRMICNHFLASITYQLMNQQSEASRKMDEFVTSQNGSRVAPRCSILDGRLKNLIGNAAASIGFLYQ